MTSSLGLRPERGGTSEASKNHILFKRGSWGPRIAKAWGFFKRIRKELDFYVKSADCKMLMTKFFFKKRTPYNSNRKHLLPSSQATSLGTYSPQQPVTTTVVDEGAYPSFRHGKHKCQLWQQTASLSLGKEEMLPSGNKSPSTLGDWLASSLRS